MTTEDKLDAIFRMQKEFAKRIEKIPNPKFGFTSQYRIDRLMQAVIHEAVELQDLTQWKWWKKGTKPMDLYEAREELIDIFHFVIHAAIVLDMTPKMFLDTYTQKMQINHKRQDTGY